MRAFTKLQVSVFLNTFGEDLLLTSGKSIVVIFEESTIAIETEAGYVETSENYFTTYTGSASYTDTFTWKGKQQEIYNITDDLSGVSNYYFRSHE